MVAHPVDDGVTGRKDGHTVQVRSRRCGGGGCIRHLCRIRCRNSYNRRVDAESRRCDLRDLLEQALSHFGAAMVQHDRPVLIDMDQGPRLIEVGQRKGNPEFDGGKGDPLFQGRVFRVPFCNRRPPRRIIGRCDQRFGHFMQQEILNRHSIGRGVARGLGVIACHFGIVIHAPHRDRIMAKVMGDVIDDTFDPQNALRPAEPAIGRGRLHVGFQAVGRNPRMGQQIGVIRMQHGTVCHRQR